MNGTTKFNPILIAVPGEALPASKRSPSLIAVRTTPTTAAILIVRRKFARLRQTLIASFNQTTGVLPLRADFT
jgi:hypothetical protein